MFNNIWLFAEYLKALLIKHFFISISSNFSCDHFSSRFISLINPLIQEYMEKNSIDIVIDKKHIFIAKSDHDITKDILEIVNNKIK